MQSAVKVHWEIIAGKQGALGYYTLRICVVDDDRGVNNQYEMGPFFGHERVSEWGRATTEFFAQTLRGLGHSVTIAD